jgi:hypothetical protein
MLKALGLNKSSSATAESKNARTLHLLDDAISLEYALRSMDLLMDDRMDQIPALLQDGNSAFFKLAQGVISFIEATLGFEPEEIKKATNTLYDAEQAAWKDHQKAVHSGVSSSSHFPPGLVYSVAYAEAQLLSAVTLFLSESVIDSAKALYKLRKAYQTIVEVNKQFTSKQSLKSVKTSSTTSSHMLKRKSHATESGHDSSGELTAESLKDKQIKQKLFKFYKLRLERLKQDCNDDVINSLIQANIEDPSMKAGQETVDEYIISAINACFGILQLVLSIIPPGIGRVLSIVGFHGSEIDGLTMLWKATNTMNIHGSIALLALFQFYDGPTQVSDIKLPEKDPSSSSSSEESSKTLIDDNVIPDLDDVKDVKRKLKRSLSRTAKHYSRGALWQLQEGRLKASEGDLITAVEIMNDTSRGPINLRQVEGLMLFDKTMFMIALHDFDHSAANFLRLIKINSWSHMFYTYLSAMCQVEIYREHKVTDAKKAQEARDIAKKLILEAPAHLAKKKAFSKPMPFDKFVLRKLDQWKEISKKKNIHLVDAIGTSPIHEVIYFWNGFGRMPIGDLDKALKLLGYTGAKDTPFSGNNALIIDETDDESLIRYLLQSVALRYLKRTEEGLELLQKKVIPKIYTEAPEKGHFASGLSRVNFLKRHRDPWVAPSAIYEMAVMHWTLSGAKEVQLVRDYLELANSWGDDYELSTRVGLKIKSALSRLDRLDV